MIRINLLPIRAFKKKENIRRQVSIYFLTTIFLIGVMGFVYTITREDLLNLQRDQQDLAAREANLAKMVREVQSLEKQLEELDQKVKTILVLEAQRRGPVEVLQGISHLIPPQRAWLTELTETGQALTLKGVAMDNETIAEFMTNLDGRPGPRPAAAAGQAGQQAAPAPEGEARIFRDVELVRSAQEIVNDIRLKSFSITCQIVLQQGEQPADEEATQGGGNAPPQSANF